MTHFTKFILPIFSYSLMVLINCTISNALAEDHIVNLTVGYKTVYFAGKPRTAIAVNNQIPAPTLHFKDGDHITLQVFNHLNQETAIHWHGILLPWQMDGVLGISQKGIPPNQAFRYTFTLHQSGTYWYHAHAGLQEQSGLYGAFIIDPKNKPAYQVTKDYVIVLSDWSNTYPDQILANLKKEGDYYSPRFPLQPSLIKFIHDYRHASTHERKNIIADYKMMQQMRMSLYDISDVAYDAFLLNGKPSSQPWTAPVKIGDVVRLRFIGAGGSTIFHVKMPGTSMQIVQVQGNDVNPYIVNDFNIAPGETYDVLVNIQKNDPTLIYAESIDTLGAAVGALITSPNQPINFKQITPFPEPLPASRDMMTQTMDEQTEQTSSHSMHMEMGEEKMQHDMPMTHSATMHMPTEPTVHGDMISTPDATQKTVGTKYQTLTAAVKTNDPHKPVDHEIKMELFGYMDHFIWFINGVPEYNAHPILLEPNKRYRFVFTNPTMMHHPMHFHGHWFILRNGHGQYDPLLHTIDIPPGATVTADVDTDASGQWLFHCHLLYHMMAGMSRVFQYDTLIEITNDTMQPQNEIKQTSYHNRPIVRVDEVRPIDLSLIHHPMAHAMNLNFANFLDVSEDPIHDIQKINFKGLYGHDFNKLELFTNDAEIKNGTIDTADMDIFYWHLLDQFWAVKGGVNYFYRPAQTPYWQPGIGIEGLTPYFIHTDVRAYYHDGAAKLDLEFLRDTQITNNGFIKLGIRSILATKSVTQAEIGSGLNQMRYIIEPYYRLMPGLNVFAEYEYEKDYGAFKQFQTTTGESSTQNTLSIGLSMVF